MATSSTSDSAAADTTGADTTGADATGAGSAAESAAGADTGAGADSGAGLAGVHVVAGGGLFGGLAPWDGEVTVSGGRRGWLGFLVGVLLFGVFAGLVVWRLGSSSSAGSGLTVSVSGSTVVRTVSESVLVTLPVQTVTVSSSVPPATTRPAPSAPAPSTSKPSKPAASKPSSAASKSSASKSASSSSSGSSSSGVPVSVSVVLVCEGEALVRVSGSGVGRVVVSAGGRSGVGVLSVVLGVGSWVVSVSDSGGSPGLVWDDPSGVCRGRA